MRQTCALLLMLLAFTLTACDSGVSYPVDDYFNATVVSSEIDGDTVILTIDGEGFYPMTAKVTFVDGVMTEFEVTEHSESAAWGGVIIDAGDLQAEIVEQAANLNAIDAQDYSVIDAEAGATAIATVDAILNIANAAVDHFNAYYAE